MKPLCDKHYKTVEQDDSVMCFAELPTETNLDPAPDCLCKSHAFEYYYKRKRLTIHDDIKYVKRSQCIICINT